MLLVATCARLAESVRWVPVVECRMLNKTESYTIRGESFSRESVALKAAHRHVLSFKDTGLRPWNDAETYQQVQV